MVNTHDFDNIDFNIDDDLVIVTSVPKEDTINELKLIIKNHNAIRAINLILTDRHNNYEPHHNLDAFDLLYKLAYKIKHQESSEIMHLVEEQLSDIIMSGPCSQGRCYRILQLVESI